MSAYGYLLCLVVGAMWLGAALLLGRPVPSGAVARFGSLFVPCLGVLGLLAEALHVVDDEMLRLGAVVGISGVLSGLAAWVAPGVQR